jgi:ribose-phosphate pyrophosphokinase
MKILSGLGNKKLAKHLALELNCQYIESYITNFDDSETRVQILEDLYDSEVAIVQSTSKPVNNRLMELLLLVDTVKRAGAKRITAIMPYFGYSRQDRVAYKFAPISARLMVNLLEVAGVDRVITVDLHSKQLEGFFKISMQNLNPISLFSPIIKASNNSIIVSPDIGGLMRARVVSEFFNMDIAVINKSRNMANECSVSEIIGSVKGKHCLVIDDIVDSGQTLCKGAKLLMEKGALAVDAFITHPVLSGLSKENIQASEITNIYLTDTIETVNLPIKFQVISILPIIAEAIPRSMRL